jgi:UDP-N-acetylglucosamine 1-carboxyvinyltransferase
VRVEGCDPGVLRVLFDVLERMGVPHEIGDNWVQVRGVPKLRPIDIATLPYPGFPTDLQAQLMAVLTRAEGISIITEKVYPDRFMHVAELSRLGARIRKEGPTAIIEGGRRLSGADVMASDLRASASLVMAALVAEGTTRVHRIYHLDRGYVHMERKLARLGAEIGREHDETGV